MNEIKPKLLMCDLDGTLALKWQPVLLDGRFTELKRLNLPVVIVTNQGGVHAHYAWQARDRPDRAAEYPTLAAVQRRLTAVTRQLPMVHYVYAALHVGHDDYPLPEENDDIVRTLPTGTPFHASWNPSWRKPDTGMLKRACADFGIAPHEALMVGDREDDWDAAAALGMPFVRVNEEAWQPGFLAMMAA